MVQEVLTRDNDSGKKKRPQIDADKGCGSFLRANYEPTTAIEKKTRAITTTAVVAQPEETEGDEPQPTGTESK